MEQVLGPGGPGGRCRKGVGTLSSLPIPIMQEWTEAKELLQEPEEEEDEEDEGEEEETPSRDASPEPPSRRLQRVQDKTGKLPRVREEL